MRLILPLCQQQKRKLRLYISNTFNPARPDADDSDGSIASWELRVEGKLLDDVSCFSYTNLTFIVKLYLYLSSELLGSLWLSVTGFNDVLKILCTVMFGSEYNRTKWSEECFEMKGKMICFDL